MDITSLKDFFILNNSYSLTASDEVGAYFHKTIIRKNDFLLKEGSISDKYLLLGSGYMRAYAYDLNGDSVTTGFYAAGKTVFEVASWFNRQPSTENIQAITDCEGWYINYKDLTELSANLPAFREFTQSMLVQGFMALKNNALSLINESAEQRYSRLSETYPDICNNAPLKHIASFLGITDSSLSRIRKQALHKAKASLSF